LAEIFDFSCIPRILSIQTVKFSSNIYLIPRILRILIDSFRVFSVYEQIHSAYFQYTNRFIPRTLSKRTDSFRVIRECTQIISNIRNGIIFITAFKGIILQKKVCMCPTGPKTCKNRLFGPSMTKKFPSAYSDYTWNDLRI
jgi:hypothetical protein